MVEPTSPLSVLMESSMRISDNPTPFEERHYTIAELAEMWKFSTEFVRQIVRGEPGVTEWVRQQPGRRRYSVIRVPQSVAERLYRRALARSEQGPAIPRSYGRRLRAASGAPSPRERNDVR
jgi:hypothetical protein